MINRRQLLAAAGIGFIAGPVLAEPAYRAGKEYFELRTIVPTPTDSIEVVEFFAYTCPHCLQFAPYAEAWKKNLPKDVAVRVCPVAWSPKYLPFAQTYFALKQLGELERLHMPFFESVVYQERTYTPDTCARDIAGFMKDNGIDPELWKKTMRSFNVQNQTRKATQTWNAYGIDSTPMIGVAGRYTTGPHLTSSREDTINLINTLIEKVRTDRA